MMGVELRAALMMRASKPCESKGEAPVGEGAKPASTEISTSPGRGTELGVSENTSGSASSS